MDETTDNVKTIVGKDLSGYIKKSRLESLLEELFGKKIDVSMSNDRYWFYAPPPTPTQISRLPIYNKITPFDPILNYSHIDSRVLNNTMMFTLSETDRRAGEKDVFDRWWQYPSNIVLEPSIVNLQSYSDRMSDARPTLFCGSSLETEVEIIDVRASSEGSRAFKAEFCTSEDVEQYISQTATPTTRIISLHCQNSLEPLKITEECLNKVLSFHHVGIEFLDLLFAFGGKPRESEAGLGGLTSFTADMSYLLVYVEESRGKEKVSWPIRQTAVFRRFAPDTPEENLWIFIHPMPNSVLKGKVEDAITHGTQFRNCTSVPQLHSLAISSYIENSRWYLKALSEEFEDIADIALTLEFSRPEDYTEAFKTLAKLQYLQERILPSHTRFNTTASIVSGLQELNSSFHDQGFLETAAFIALDNSFKSYISKYRGHVASIDLLKSRVQGVLNQLTVALTLKNQATSVDINHNMLLLTHDTVDDSATVKVVTLVTLLYLPASFVASLLGMNLFAFQGPNGNGFQISSRFWIFVALTVPLTVLTVGSWFYIAYKRKRNKAIKQRSQQKGWPGLEV
ncbi:uncharacterized protein PAC_01358 [Phialocephala subalpina]|uniref:CorA-like transporter domain-containing protein n=1 Tax=Phialocephala subalpina TaxID=576137 RepID=A0A1L7WFD5_9HELO|nr:uncharacterized protein PAC_01358 [Phialocephala subalpina]